MSRPSPFAELLVCLEWHASYRHFCDRWQNSWWTPADYAEYDTCESVGPDLTRTDADVAFTVQGHHHFYGSHGPRRRAP